MVTLASESTAEEWFQRQCTEVKIATPTTMRGKTVANVIMGKTGCEAVHCDVGVTPIGRSTVLVRRIYLGAMPCTMGRQELKPNMHLCQCLMVNCVFCIYLI